MRASLFVLLALLVAPTARAEIVMCVNSINDLVGAIHEADNQDVVAHVAKNIYTLSSWPSPPSGDSTFDDALTLIGGYNDDCSSRETLDPAFTVIRMNSSATDAISIRSDDDLRIESITFADASRGMQLYSYTGIGTTSIELSRVRISGMCQGHPQCAVGGVALDIAGTDEVDFRQVLVDNNASSGCAVLVRAYALDVIHVVNSTIVDNAGRGMCLEDTSGGDSYEAEIYNSIFWNNGGTDLRTLNSPHIFLSRNIAETSSFNPPPESGPFDLIAQNPQFGGSPPYRPADTSPAVNFGTVSVAGGIPGTDFRGDPRVIGTRPDLGVYETTVDNVNNLVVTTASDILVGGQPISGSLRWAITQANASSSADMIRFNIAGACPRLITLASPLPDLVGLITIDGYSQPGSTVNTTSWGTNANLCIGVKGNQSVNHAFHIPTSGTSTRAAIKGLGIGGFTDAAIRVEGGVDHEISGNQFGGTLDGNDLDSNRVNIRIGGVSMRTRVGGPEMAQRNLISSAALSGLEIVLGANNTRDNIVQNNLIGTNSTGNSAAPNLVGATVMTSNNTFRDNVISGNNVNGITFDGTAAVDNRLTGNTIGRKAGLVICFPLPCSPNYALPNNLHGVTFINGASRNVVINNTIASNLGDGVVVDQGNRNMILLNSIHSNGGIGIDLENDGADTNDNDAAAGSGNLANRGLNWPVITRATGGNHNGHDGRVQGTFSSTTGSYILMFYADTTCGNSSRGSGRYTLPGDTVVVSAPLGFQGTTNFDIDISTTSTNLVGKAISGIAIDGNGNTSEFSTCRIFDDIIFQHDFEPVAE